MQRPSSCVVQGSPVLESQTSGSDPGRDPRPTLPFLGVWLPQPGVPRPPTTHHLPGPVGPARAREGVRQVPPFISSFTQFPLRAGKGVKRWSPRLPPGRRGGSSHVQASLRRHAWDPERQAHVGAETEAPAAPARRSGFLHREPAAELASPQNEPMGADQRHHRPPGVPELAVRGRAPQRLLRRPRCFPQAARSRAELAGLAPRWRPRRKTGATPDVCALHGPVASLPSRHMYV